MTLQEKKIERAHVALGLGGVVSFTAGIALIVGFILSPTRMEAEMGMNADTGLLIGGVLLLAFLLFTAGARHCAALKKRLIKQQDVSEGSRLRL